jgi:hypothetical protein
MAPPAFQYGKRTTGRPPVAALTADDLKTIQSYYLPTNRNKREGSILLAWVRFCESRAEFSHLVADHMPATTIPTAVVDACRAAKPLIGPHRGGPARLRHESAYVPGTMRKNHEGTGRLIAGERASVDDATRNTACYIPWPWGGCPCSDKFGVRLGRWQTLLVHDDATSFIPYVSSVFRWAQSYRGTDAAGVIYHAETDVCQWEHWAVEGGVWQSKRTLAVLGGRFVSAKGRPNQKLVENYIGRLWTIMAGQPGDVGRHQAEMKAASELYVACRAGRQDPRKHFLPLTTAQLALYESIAYLNEKRLASRTYGEWVPKSRWEADLEKRPRAARATTDDFLILPCAETRKVRRGTVKITEDGPHGVPMIWTFAADWLWQHEGADVTCYFDPLAAWPVPATITLAGSRKALGTAECISPFGESKDRAADMVKAIRQSMMTETRNLITLHTARTVRHAAGVLTTSTAKSGAKTDPAIRPDRLTLDPLPEFSRGSREPVAASPRVTRDDLSRSLSRRAELARQLSMQP